MLADNTKTIDCSAFSGALAAVEKNQIVLITGRAGTGKTTFVKELLKQDVRQAVVAPTGIAALQANGQTIHSMFRLAPFMQDLSAVKKLHGREAALVMKLQRLIIDEISMVRADLLDRIDQVLKLTRGKPQPFGGLQVVMIGDFYQLPPVIPMAEEQMLVDSGYTQFYALGAKCLKNVDVHVVELKQIFRQRDPAFVEMLGAIRSGVGLEDVIARLNRQCVGPHRAGAEPLLLCGTNQVAEAHNHEMLQSLSGQSRFYHSTMSGDFKLTEEQLPAPAQLELKVNARVMLLKNDPERRWFNGSLGTVTRLGEKSISVKLDADRKDYEIEAYAWKKYRYSWNMQTLVVEAEEMGAYAQLPVKPAWASTIHKAQGLSLDDVRIDLGRGFASGQAYVALSRATSLAGLSLASPLAVRDVLVDRNIALMLQQPNVLMV